MVSDEPYFQVGAQYVLLSRLQCFTYRYKFPSQFLTEHPQLLSHLALGFFCCYFSSNPQNLGKTMLIYTTKIMEKRVKAMVRFWPHLGHNCNYSANVTIFRASNPSLWPESETRMSQKLKKHVPNWWMSPGSVLTCRPWNKAVHGQLWLRRNYISMANGRATDLYSACIQSWLIGFSSFDIS